LVYTNSTYVQNVNPRVNFNSTIQNRFRLAAGVKRNNWVINTPYVRYCIGFLADILLYLVWLLPERKYMLGVQDDTFSSALNSCRKTETVKKYLRTYYIIIYRASSFKIGRYGKVGQFQKAQFFTLFCTLIIRISLYRLRWK